MSSAADPAGADAAPIPGSGRPRIPTLLIEDNPGDVRLVKEMFREPGSGYAQRAQYDVHVASSLAEAMSAVSSTFFEVLLVDLSLPDSSGMDTVRSVLAAAPRSALIVLTGLKDEGAAGAALREGAQDYLQKGRVDADLLLRSIRYARERKRIEEELREKEVAYREAFKMEAVGRLAGGIAHDFNNLLTAILGYGELILHRGSLDWQDRENLHEIRRAAERAAALTRQLLAFGRKQILLPQVFDLNELVSGVESMLRRLLGDDVEIVERLAPAPGSIRADRGQIEQVLVNLALNSREAMPRGGRLTIETREVETLDAVPGERGDLPPGPYVLLSVSDNGVGMDGETLKHIFEPFFTTKEMGRGTGLGLATVYGIVRQSNGTIRVSSEPGRGTRMDLYFPSVAERPAGERGAEAGPSAELMARPGETVLLVEEENALRGLGRSALQHYGYRVLDARDGVRALEAVESDGGRRIDLLVTDVVMPRMSGTELAARLRESNPGLKTLFVTSDTNGDVVERRVLGPDAPVLQKPVGPTILAREVRRVLDQV